MRMLSQKRKVFLNRLHKLCKIIKGSLNVIVNLVYFNHLNNQKNIMFNAYFNDVYIV